MHVGDVMKICMSQMRFCIPYMVFSFLFSLLTRIELCLCFFVVLSFELSTLKKSFIKNGECINIE